MKPRHPNGKGSRIGGNGEGVHAIALDLLILDKVSTVLNKASTSSTPLNINVFRLHNECESQSLLSTSPSLSRK